jgi:hypothetical protein
VLRPLVARAFLLRGEEGLAYLHNYGTEVQARWAQFQQHMNQLSLSADERGQIVKAAGDFFQQLDSVFRALYPFSPKSKVCLVTSINPDAGWHAMPADAREVQAAIRAGTSAGSGILIMNSVTASGADVLPEATRRGRPRFTTTSRRISTTRCTGWATCSRGAGCRPFSWRINWKFWSKNW